MAPKYHLRDNFWCFLTSVLRSWVSPLLVLLASSSFLWAAPPTSENAYCGKGDVAQFGEKDGPAQLPTACFYTGLDGTPSPGKQIHVAAKSDFMSALDGAKCGDTLLLAAGA